MSPTTSTIAHRISHPCIHLQNVHFDTFLHFETKYMSRSEFLCTTKHWTGTKMVEYIPPSPLVFLGGSFLTTSSSFWYSIILIKILSFLGRQTFSIILCGDVMPWSILQSGSKQLPFTNCRQTWNLWQASPWNYTGNFSVYLSLDPLLNLGKP